MTEAKPKEFPPTCISRRHLVGNSVYSVWTCIPEKTNHLFVTKGGIIVYSTEFDAIGEDRKTIIDQGKDLLISLIEKSEDEKRSLYKKWRLSRLDITVNRKRTNNSISGNTVRFVELHDSVD